MGKLLVLVLALALAAPAVALAASVHVRVEGETRTIFGPTEVAVVASTPLQALEQASILGEFYYHVALTPFGPYVDQIGRYGSSGSSGWVFKVNGVSPPVGADKVQLANGDDVLWYYATFGANGGPPTLVLTKTSARCYAATGQDDTGAKTVPTGLVYHTDGRTIAAPAGHICFAKVHGLVWATAPGAVRSNRLP